VVRGSVAKRIHALSIPSQHAVTHKCVAVVLTLSFVKNASDGPRFKRLRRLGLGDLHDRNLWHATLLRPCYVLRAELFMPS
jgi:hypothetical protein